MNVVIGIDQSVNTKSDSLMIEGKCHKPSSIKVMLSRKSCITRGELGVYAGHSAENSLILAGTSAAPSQRRPEIVPLTARIEVVDKVNIEIPVRRGKRDLDCGDGWDWTEQKLELRRMCDYETARKCTEKYCLSS